VWNKTKGKGVCNDVSGKGICEYALLETITYMKLEGDRIQMGMMFGQETLIQGRVLEGNAGNSKVAREPFDESDAADRTVRR
jgi:hypothetical protein